MKQHVWYSPKLNRLETVSVPECGEYKWCRWDFCPQIMLDKKTGKSLGVWYYMGEL